MTNHVVRRLLLAAAGVVAVVQAQPRPAFEVAPVKRNVSGANLRIGMSFLPGGRFSATNVPLQVMIATAYNVPFQSARLSGGPEWLREGYDIEATAEKGAIPVGLPAKARQEKMKLMFQSPLADRFKLTIRRETKELPVYALVVAKTGPKLQKAKIEEKDCPEVPTPDVSCHQFNGGQGRGLHGKAVDMPDLVQFVEIWTDRPLLDRTGIQGFYDIETDGWTPLLPRPPRPPGAEPSAEDLALADPIRPTLFAVFERLGLKMETQKAPVETFAIDHVERPSEN
jgi:uncharacterized protein (TIGR03435 family)